MVADAGHALLVIVPVLQRGQGPAQHPPLWLERVLTTKRWFGWERPQTGPWTLALSAEVREEPACPASLRLGPRGQQGQPRRAVFPEPLSLRAVPIWETEALARGRGG